MIREAECYPDKDDEWAYLYKETEDWYIKEK